MRWVSLSKSVTTPNQEVCCFPKGAPPQEPVHLLRTEISATKTPPVCSMRCFRLSHVSRDQRESHVYPPRLMYIYIQTQFLVSNQVNEICINFAACFLGTVFYFSVIIGAFWCSGRAFAVYLMRILVCLYGGCQWAALPMQLQTSLLSKRKGVAELHLFNLWPLWRLLLLFIVANCNSSLDMKRKH